MILLSSNIRLLHKNKTISHATRNTTHGTRNTKNETRQQHYYHQTQNTTTNEAFTQTKECGPGQILQTNHFIPSLSWARCQLDHSQHHLLSPARHQTTWTKNNQTKGTNKKQPMPQSTVRAFLLSWSYQNSHQITVIAMLIHDIFYLGPILETCSKIKPSSHALVKGRHCAVWNTMAASYTNLPR